ncbi:hypothetical protein F5144DRAFT_594205 [Chaetomium tenue]|uniref:Uncharacterized protein n=1 Tax=Chaetomium tenue TaxID=1854479 RepID=A0ACB7P832_9PEZI|nr:hypothetical protein F5144DRAFT_594205 [Chaetomium globosum]
MATDRDTGPTGNKFHKSHKDDELRRHLTRRQQSHIELVINGHPGGPRLRDILPEVGMIWPFRTFMVGNSDERVVTALRKITPHLSKERVENFFSHMFLEAAKVIARPTHPPNGNIDFMVFIKVLQRNKYIRSYEGRYPQDVVMGECAAARAGQPPVPTGRVSKDNDVDMMADGIQDLAIQQSYERGTGGWGDWPVVMDYRAHLCDLCFYL